MRGRIVNFSFWDPRVWQSRQRIRHMVNESGTPFQNHVMLCQRSAPLWSLALLSSQRDKKVSAEQPVTNVKRRSVSYCPI